MVDALHILAIVLVALAAALSVAHALEMPGKMRLDKENYLTVQCIYYPGFTFGGISEPLGTAATAILLNFVPAGSSAFWLTLIALVAMFAMMAVFWLVTQPANKVWTQNMKMGAAGAGFFKAGPGTTDVTADWTAMRDRWEWSHVARAAFATVAFLALLTALAIRS
ncbi:MAG TPA: DUF1772 domain-containing protein [Xanthobacteraceae bacterium]|nr:DUF1772 domain-containing protein [Xanthobacteraceae bacterium]